VVRGGERRVEVKIEGGDCFYCASLPKMYKGRPTALDTSPPGFPFRRPQLARGAPPHVQVQPVHGRALHWLCACDPAPVGGTQGHLSGLLAGDGDRRYWGGTDSYEGIGTTAMQG